MLSTEIINRFKEKRPVCLMARMSLSTFVFTRSNRSSVSRSCLSTIPEKDPFLCSHRANGRGHFVLVTECECGLQEAREKLIAARSCVFNKLDRVEPQVAQALVRYSYEQTRQICNQMRMWSSSDVAGYRTKILDGNHLSGTEHRLQELRTERAAALPGKSLVVLDPRCRAIQDMFPIEDARTGTSAFDEVIKRSKLTICGWPIATSARTSLCTSLAEPCTFVIRHHHNVVVRS